jgi:hypothetical protein
MQDGKFRRRKTLLLAWVWPSETFSRKYCRQLSDIGLRNPGMEIIAAYAQKALDIVDISDIVLYGIRRWLLESLPEVGRVGKQEMEKFSPSRPVFFPHHPNFPIATFFQNVSFTTANMNS